MAGRRGDRVALAVGLEGGAVAMVLPAVDLDDELRVGEVRSTSKPQTVALNCGLGKP
jgi:hypothetical protein